MSLKMKQYIFEKKKMQTEKGKSLETREMFKSKN